MKTYDPQECFERLAAKLDALLEQGAATREAVKGIEARVVDLEARPVARGPGHRTFTVTIDGVRPVRGVRVIYADEEDSG